MGTTDTLKKSSIRESLSPFLELLGVTQKIAVRRLGSSKKIARLPEHAVVYGLILIIWEDVQKNASVKQALYNSFLHYPQVVQYPIANDWFKAYIDGHSEQQLVTKL